MDVLWKLEPSTDAKHRLYRRYLDGWWAKMLQPTASGFMWKRVTYVDAFAGPGRYQDGEEGSPVFVLDRLLHHTRVQQLLRRDRVFLVFIERDRRRHEFLCAELETRFGPLDALPVTVQVRRGEAAEETPRALNELRAWRNPILVLFDSWGNVNVPLSLISQIARNRGSEVLVTLGPNWFNRRQNLNADQLDAVFGGREWWTRAAQTTDTDEQWRAWLITYRDALARAGFEYQLDFQVVPHSGQPLYLVYGTGHPAGVEVMKDAMWSVDQNDGMSFRDPRIRHGTIPGQLSLFAGSDIVTSELLELVMHRVERGVVTVAALREWLLRETARWQPKHATPALQQLRDQQRVTIEPAGRITKSSIVRPR